MRERLGSLVFGGGSTMEQIALASQRGELQMDIACVLAGKDGIEAIDRARKLKIPVEIVDQEEFRGSDGKVDEYGFRYNNRLSGGEMFDILLKQVAEAKMIKGEVQNANPNFT